MLQIILLQAQQGGSIQSLIMFGLIFVVIYFFMIRPQVKRQRELKKFREALKKGDKIITIGGLHGKITELNDTTAIIEVEEGAKIKIERSAIAMDNADRLGTEKK
jgi:preprotein translocase subunit YajC